MVEYYSFARDIPPIPEELIDPLDVIESRKNLFPVDIADMYATYFVSDELQEWGQQFFDYAVDVRYQVIRKALPVHTDLGTDTNPFKYNYLITLGGDNIKTMWWDEDNNLLESFVAPINTWHRINILQPHSISELTSVRLSVTMKKSK